MLHLKKGETKLSFQQPLRPCLQFNGVNFHPFHGAVDFFFFFFLICMSTAGALLMASGYHHLSVLSRPILSTKRVFLPSHLSLDYFSHQWIFILLALLGCHCSLI